MNVCPLRNAPIVQLFCEIMKSASYYNAYKHSRNALIVQQKETHPGTLAWKDHNVQTQSKVFNNKAQHMKQVQCYSIITQGYKHTHIHRLSAYNSDGLWLEILNTFF